MSLRILCFTVLSGTLFLIGCGTPSGLQSEKDVKNSSGEDEYFERLRKNKNIVELESDQRIHFVNHSYVAPKGWFWRKPSMGTGSATQVGTFSTPQKFSVTTRLVQTNRRTASLEELIENHADKYRKLDGGKVESLLIGKFEALKLDPGNNERMPHVYSVKLDANTWISISYSNATWGSKKWQTTPDGLETLDKEIRALISSLQYKPRFVPGQKAKTLRGKQ